MLPDLFTDNGSGQFVMSREIVTVGEKSEQWNHSDDANVFLKNPLSYSRNRVCTQKLHIYFLILAQVPESITNHAGKNKNE